MKLKNNNKLSAQLDVLDRIDRHKDNVQVRVCRGIFCWWSDSCYIWELALRVILSNLEWNVLVKIFWIEFKHWYYNIHAMQNTCITIGGLQIHATFAFLNTLYIAYKVHVLDFHPTLIMRFYVVRNSNVQPQLMQR